MSAHPNEIIARVRSRVLLVVAVIVLLIPHCGLAGASQDSPFIFVFIDSKTEKSLGAFPYDRGVLAKGIEKATASGAAGVVLKFFIDKPKTIDGDRKLAEAAKRSKLIVQARLDDTEPSPNALADRFALNISAAGKPISGASGWLPVPDLSAAATDLGFIDYRTIDHMPVVECYRGRMVRSLYLCCIELALKEHAEIVPARSIRLHGKTVGLNEYSEIVVTYPAKDDLSYIPFSDFLNEPPRPEIKDRVVVIGYDSDRFQPVDTPAGKLRPHRAFAHALLSMYQQFR